MPQYEPLDDAAYPLDDDLDVEGNAFPVIPTVDGREDRLNELMLRAFTGTLNRGRPLKYWENLRLKPIHIQIIVMRAAGYKNTEIAERFGMDAGRISVIVNHPDAQSVLAHLVSFQADKLLDVKARIQAHAGEALDVALSVMRDETEKGEVRAGISFKLLSAAGYGAVQKSESVVKVELPAEHASALTAALAEADRLQEANYAGLQEVGRSFAGAHAGEGPSSSEIVASPVNSSESDGLNPPQPDQYESPIRAITRRSA